MSISGWAGEHAEHAGGQVSIDGRAASATVSRGRPKHFPLSSESSADTKVSTRSCTPEAT